MALLQTLKSFVNERLSTAAEEICVVVERIITEYEDQAFSSKQQIEQQQRILDAVLKPDIKLHKTGSYSRLTTNTGVETGLG